MSACCSHCCSWSCYNSFIYLCNFMFFLELLLQHMQLFLCYIPCLHAIFMLRRHLIVWVSKVAFIILILQLCSVLVLSRTFLLHSLHSLHSLCSLHSLRSLNSVCCLQLLFMMLLDVMLLLSYLDVLVYEQLDICVRRKSHRHLIDCISRCALDGVFNSTLLETIIPTLLRGIWTTVIPGDMETLMASNLSVKNQNELENWLATYLCDWSWRLHNFNREVRRSTAKTAQGIVWATGRLTDY